MFKKLVSWIILSCFIAPSLLSWSGFAALQSEDNKGLVNNALEKHTYVDLPASTWPVDHWARPFVKALVEDGIFTPEEIEFLTRTIGIGKPISFSAMDLLVSRTQKIRLPNRVLSSTKVSREKLCQTVYLSLRYAGSEVLPKAEALDQNGLHWKDAGAFEGYGYQAALTLRALGIVEGSDNFFYPKRETTLEEALTIFAKAMDKNLRNPVRLASEAFIMQNVVSFSENECTPDLQTVREKEKDAFLKDT